MIRGVIVAALLALFGALAAGTAEAGPPPCGPGDHARAIAQDGIPGQPGGPPKTDGGAETGRGVAYLTEGRRATTGETEGDILSASAQTCPPGSQADTP